MTAFYHLPGLFEFYDLYRAFLPLYRRHRAWFYPWCDIGSLYGAPADCLWGGGRVGDGENRPQEVAALLREYGVSARLTFSNSLLREEHLSDPRCNALCEAFAGSGVATGVILTSDLLLSYLRERYPAFYFISSTTKVLTDFAQLEAELRREDFRFVVPDFRLNKDFARLNALPDALKQKVEFLCNECCHMECTRRRACYEAVSRQSLGLAAAHTCPWAGEGGYRFSAAMERPAFIGIRDIQNVYLPAGFRHFKIEGRSLGSAVVLEFLLYYLTRPEYQLKVREAI
jgi:collagenase-like PrtC family protease